MGNRLAMGGAFGFAALVLLATTGAEAQRIPFERRVFNEQVLRPFDQPVIPIYEGWYARDDGTHDICFGYFNLNMEEPIDIPLGERNFMEPSQYDGHQPTHFTPVPGMTPVSPFTSRFRRVWCAFTINVPADFGPDDVVRWTLQREGGPVISTPGTLNPAYILDEPRSAGRQELAPVLRLSEGGPEGQGRHGITGSPRTARVGTPLDLSVWIEHPFEQQMWVGWLKYKGPADVTFSPQEMRLRIADQAGVATTSVSFAEPGDYEILVQAINDWNAFEFHCCWTNGYVSVHVTE